MRPQPRAAPVLRQPRQNPRPHPAIQLIACLSWFDEPLELLAECASSIANAGVDHLVAVDGAYHAYPNPRGNSGTEQAQTVLAIASGANLGTTILIPQAPWAGNETEKRTRLFQLAHITATPTVDWLLVIDADETLENTGTLRQQLEHTTLDVADIDTYEHAPNGDMQYNRQHLRRLYRAQPAGIHVQGAHYIILDGDDRTLSNPIGPQPPGLNLTDARIRHRPGARPTHRQRNRAKYYDTRSQQALETTALTYRHSPHHAIPG